MPAKETSPGRVQVTFKCPRCGTTTRWTGLTSHVPDTETCSTCRTPMRMQ